MSALPDDLRRLRMPLLVGVLMILSGVGMAWVTHALRQDAEQAARMAASRLADIQTRHRQATETDQLTRETLTAYDTLRQTGLLQPPDRITWIEQIRATQSALRIDELSYEIGPDQPLSDPSPENSVKNAIFTSTLRIHGKLAHEGQFLDLLEGLRRPGKALRPRHCTLLRNPPPVSHENPSPALTASCEIDWISIRPDPP